MTAQGDTGTAALRAVLDTVFAAPDYRWSVEPAPWRFLRTWWHRLADWLQGLRADNPAVFRLLLLSVLAALILLLAHAAYVVWQTVYAGSAAAEHAPAAPRTERRDAAWYGREADRAAAAGRMAEALQLAFVALALTLEAQGLLRYQSSKTPAECARDARLVGEDRERLRELVRALYVHVFGGRPCGPDEYRSWRERSGLAWHASAR
ncbi:MAG: DUF4129 domain-containing protein [Gemmatimonadales bacterium]